jgi:hypothetical protein
MAYDPRCQELAEYFLADITLTDEDREQRTVELAQAIQDTIEDLTADLME